VLSPGVVIGVLVSPLLLIAASVPGPLFFADAAGLTT